MCIRDRQWLQRGAVLRVWTVDTFADTHVCLALGVQQITTNVPALVRRWSTEHVDSAQNASAHGRGVRERELVPAAQRP